MTAPKGIPRRRGAAGMELPPLRDRIKPGVQVLFVGINPGIRSALTGHHFAGFSNRFWPLLFEAGLVPERLTFEHDDLLPEVGIGITNIVPRPTPGVSTLTPDEFMAGRVRLTRTIRRYRPAIVAMVGVTVFRAMFPSRTGAIALGVQPERIGESAVFVLPNPSGRNANFTYAEMLRTFRALNTRLTALHRAAARSFTIPRRSLQLVEPIARVAGRTRTPKPSSGQR
jgi:TDG/mug DNA glycosylase family protein